MFSLLPCVETFKEIEIFVEQYCINCKGIEKKLFWWDLGYLEYWIGGCILSISIWKLEDENVSKTNNFFSLSLSVKTFFSGVIFLQTIFLMPAKNLVGLFLLAFACFFFQDPPSKSVRSSYGLQRTNLLTWIVELKPQVTCFSYFKYNISSTF